MVVVLSMKINKYIDHTLLKADSSKEDIEKLCKEAIKYNFKSVCINSTWIKFAKEELKDTDILVCTVIGFPLGATSTRAKLNEIKFAIEDGADELDFVINIGYIKSKMYDEFTKEVKALVEASGEKVLKAIIETCLLTRDEIIKASQLCLEAGVDFIKTSTGFSSDGAKVEDIKSIKEIVKDKAKIKASAGIRDYKTAKKMIDAGADRIGASAGVKIVGEANEY